MQKASLANKPIYTIGQTLLWVYIAPYAYWTLCVIYMGL
jgi:hypothetical protein